MVALTQRCFSLLHSPSGRRRGSHPLLRNLSTLFWLAMALAHAPALGSAWQTLLQDGLSGGALLPCIFLTGSMLLFLLKVGNVRFLRIKPDRDSCLIFCVVVALVHADMTQGPHDRALVIEINEIVATTLVAGRLLLIRHECRVARSGDHGRTTTDSCKPIFDRQTLVDSFLTHSWTLVRQAIGVRAPPARCLA